MAFNYDFTDAKSTFPDTSTLGTGLSQGTKYVTGTYNTNYGTSAADGLGYVTTNTTKYAPNATYQKYGVSAPKFQGLMGSDYDALQTALTTPGEIAANTAYKTGTNTLADTMGGQGLYGSSVMANQQRTALDQVLADTLASNAATAAATRYGMQQQDLTNASAQEMDAWKALLAENQASNQYALDVAQYGLDADKALNSFALQKAGLLDSFNQNKNQFYLNQDTQLTNQNNDLVDKLVNLAIAEPTFNWSNFLNASNNDRQNVNLQLDQLNSMWNNWAKVMGTNSTVSQNSDDSSGFNWGGLLGGALNAAGTVGAAALL